MKNKERFKLITEVYLMPVKNKQILLPRRFQTGYEDGNYVIMGGHLDGDETMKEAIIREAKEEINIQLHLNDLQYFLTMHRWCKDHGRVGCYFLANQWKGEVKNLEPNKCDDLSWFFLDKLPKNIAPYIQTVIDCYLRGINYHEFGWGK